MLNKRSRNQAHAVLPTQIMVSYSVIGFEYQPFIEKSIVRVLLSVWGLGISRLGIREPSHGPEISLWQLVLTLQQP